MEQNETPALTQVSVTGRLNVALTQQSLSVQKLQDEADALVFNEDNIEAISAFLGKLKKVDRVVEDTHKIIKAPILEQGRACDGGKNSILATTEAIRKPVLEKFNKICAEVDKRKQDADREKQRVGAITAGIEGNIIDFSTKIANCETNEQLLAVERAINLEKSPSRKEKYGEFHEKAISRFDEVLLPIIKLQKGLIKEKDAVQLELKKAEEANDPAKMELLKEKQDEIANKIQQNEINVQQQAISQSSMGIAVVEEVMPPVKSVQRIVFEIADLGVAVKKSLSLLTVEINFKEAQKVAMTLKDAGTFDDKDEIIVNGIRFFTDKKYK